MSLHLTPGELIGSRSSNSLKRRPEAKTKKCLTSQKSHFLELAWTGTDGIYLSSFTGNDLERSMIVAMIAVRVMQATLDEIINVIAMRHGGVAALWTMDMRGFVALVAVFRRAAVRVAVAHLDHMLSDAVAAWMMQMAVVKIVNMVAVLDGEVSTAWTMTMWMFGGREMAMRAHESFLSA